MTKEERAMNLIASLEQFIKTKTFMDYFDASITSKAIPVILAYAEEVRRECEKRNDILLDGMRLIKESALDRLRMDDEIISLVDYHVKRAAIMGEETSNG